MLPFLANKHKQSPGVAQVIQAKTQPEDAQDSPDAAMESAAQDIISAIEMKDQKGLAVALRAAFAILESEPHEEASQPMEESV